MRISKFSTVHGHPTFVELDGDGSDTIILMHGLGGSTNYFQPLINIFSSRFKIIRFDFKGLGRTGPDPAKKRRITIPAYVEDLDAILTGEGVSRAIVIGHSLGSVVAMHFAAKFPERVKALVVIGPGRSRAAIPAAKKLTLGMARKARDIGMPPIAAEQVETNYVAPTSSDLVRAFVREVIGAQDAEGYAQVCEAACDDSHVDPDYSAITSPCAVIAGDQDPLAPAEQVKSIQQLIPGSFFFVVKSGHQQVLEDTPGVVRAIESLLDSLVA